MSRRLKVLMTAAEAHPYIRGGGLSHVVGALARDLAARGHRVDLLLPHVPALSMDVERAQVGVLSVPVGGRNVNASILASQQDGVRVLWLSIPELFDRPSLYAAEGQDFPDNCSRFVALSRAALQAGTLLRARHDVLHAHDWPTALSCYLLREQRQHGGAGSVPRSSVLTAHNLGFQGLFWALDMPLLGLGPEHYSPERLEFFDQLSFLKGGLLSADRVVTVSPSYAREVLSAEAGRGLDGVLRARGNAFSGVLHGVDAPAWDPSTDTAIANRFRDPASPERRRNVQAFRSRVGLTDSAQPLFLFSGDLVEDTGAPALRAAAHDIVNAGAMLAVFTDGPARHVAAWKAFSAEHPHSAVVVTHPDDALVRQALAGADFLLCPSRVEPFNFLQLCAMRYGAVPVVRRTGALRDTVVDAVDPQVAGNGITFLGDGTAPLMQAVRRAVALHRDAPRYQAVQQRAAGVDVSIRAAADRYEALYAELASNTAPPAPAF